MVKIDVVANLKAYRFAINKTLFPI